MTYPFTNWQNKCIYYFCIYTYRYTNKIGQWTSQVCILYITILFELIGNRRKHGNDIRDGRPDHEQKKTKIGNMTKSCVLLNIMKISEHNKCYLQTKQTMEKGQNKYYKWYTLYICITIGNHMYRCVHLIVSNVNILIPLYLFTK